MSAIFFAIAAAISSHAAADIAEWSVLRLNNIQQEKSATIKYTKRKKWLRLIYSKKSIFL